MTPVYPNVKVFIDLDGDEIPETDYSSRAVSDIAGKSGALTSRAVDRVAPSGGVSFDLENNDRALDNILPSLVGKAVSIGIEFEGRYKQIWFGYINADIDFDSGFVNPQRVKIAASDWLKIASNTRVKGLSVRTFLRANEALIELIDILPRPPSYLVLDDGTEIFANMFDGAKDKSKAFAEIDRIVKSELGKLYLNFRENQYGETLRLEANNSRGADRSISRIPASVVNVPRRKYYGNAGQTGRLKYYGNGSQTGYRKLYRGQDASFGYIHKDANWSVGNSLVNEFSVTNALRLTDTVDVILYEVEYPIPLGTGQSETITVPYTNPQGGSLIQAFDVALSLGDITFNSLKDGTGTNLASNLQLNQIAYANNIVLTFFNGGPPGFLKFIVRGKGIYKFNPVEVPLENAKSKEETRLEAAENLTREYSNDLVTSRAFAHSALAKNSFPRKELLSVTYQGNTSEALLAAFMHLEEGDKVRISEIFPAYANKEFYITGVSFRLNVNTKAVSFTWNLEEETESFTTPIAIRASSSASQTAVDFGIQRHLTSLQSVSYSMWIKRHHAASYAILLGQSVDDGTGRRGTELFLNSSSLTFRSFKTPTDGIWTATSVVPTLSVYYHIVVVYDNTSDRAVPKFYVNGSATSVTVDVAPSGTTDDNSDCPLIIFNRAVDPLELLDEYDIDIVNNVSVKDFRIYGKELTPEEITELSSNEDDYTTVPDGKLFHGFYAPSDRLSEYVGDLLDADDYILDAMKAAAGKPYNEFPDSPTLILKGENL